MKLTDTQLVILSAASQREDRAVESPPNLKGGAAQKVVRKLLSAGLVEEVPARGTLPVWRKDENEGAVALRITEHGIQAIGIVETSPASGGAKSETSEPAAAAGTKPHQASGPRRKSGSKDRATRGGVRPSKQERVIEMLRRSEGATIPAIMKATGWQQHSVRGFFAGVVRKKLRLTLVSDKTDRGRLYRIRSGKGAKGAAKTKRRA